MSEYKGYDISYCQEGLSMADVKASGGEFVVIRAGIATHKDVTMDAFVSGASAIKLPYGFYWYAYAENAAEAREEAKACINVIKGFSPVLPVYYDVERTLQLKLSKDVLTSIYKAFCEEIKAAGFIPGIYLNPSFWNACDNAQFKDYEVWLAHWVKESSYIGKTNCTMWQWGTTKVGRFTVDADICYKKYWDNSAPVETPEPAPATPASSAPVATAIKKGDKVAVKENALFVGNIKPFAFVYKTQFDVLRISYNCKEALIGLDGCITGWMYIADLIKVEKDTEKPTAPGGVSSGKSVEELAKEVINGEWGNGEERYRRLTAAGYSYNDVQARVNEIIYIK